MIYKLNISKVEEKGFLMTSNLIIILSVEIAKILHQSIRVCDPLYPSNGQSIEIYHNRS